MERFKQWFQVLAIPDRLEVVLKGLLIFIIELLVLQSIKLV